MRGIMGLADRANQYVDAHEALGARRRIRRKAAEVLAVCTQGINLFRVLMSYLAPVLPQMAREGRQVPAHLVRRLEFGGHAAVQSPDRAPTSRWRCASIPRSWHSSVATDDAVRRAAKPDAKPAKKSRRSHEHRQLRRRRPATSHRRFRQARPARGQSAEREIRRRLRQTTAAHAGSRHRASATCSPASAPPTTRRSSSAARW